MNTTRKCEICGARWPAMITLEAYNNRKRMGEFHPGEPCKDEYGKFGPPNPSTNMMSLP